jgi:hypothetical protein
LTTNVFSFIGQKNVQVRKDLDPDPAGTVINWPFGSGSVIQDYGSAVPDYPKEMFTIHNNGNLLLSIYIETIE